MRFKILNLELHFIHVIRSSPNNVFKETAEAFIVCNYSSEKAA